MGWEKNIFKYIHFYCFMMAESMSMDTPMKRYSSGMYVRLAFAVPAGYGEIYLNATCEIWGR
jgi:ABC-type polysaccharide/polyol phosphate transport system ATPase subunit